MSNSPHSSPSSQATNTALVRRLYDELYTKCNLAILDQLLAADVKLIDSSAPQFRGGLAAFKERESELQTAFPNKASKIDDIFAADDRVVVRWTTQGTHKGELQDIAPTGKNIKVTGISIYRLANGKIAEIIQSWDRLALLEQLDVIEPSMALHR